jgi:hypothetical protein
VVYHGPFVRVKLDRRKSDDDSEEDNDHGDDGEGFGGGTGDEHRWSQAVSTTTTLLFPLMFTYSILTLGVRLFPLEEISLDLFDDELTRRKKAAAAAAAAAAGLNPDGVFGHALLSGKKRAAEEAKFGASKKKKVVPAPPVVDTTTLVKGDRVGIVRRDTGRMMKATVKKVVHRYAGYFMWVYYLLC